MRGVVLAVLLLASVATPQSVMFPGPGMPASTGALVPVFDNKCTNTAVTNAATVACAPAGGVAANTLVVVFCGVAASGTSPSSVSDGTLTATHPTGGPWAQGNSGIDGYYYQNYAGGTPTFTCTFSGASTNRRTIFVSSWTGVALTGAYDKQAHAGYTAVTGQIDLTGGIATAAANELVVASWQGINATLTVSSVNNGFTNRNASTVGLNMDTNGAAGVAATYTPSFTVSSTNTGVFMAMAFAHQ